jgi:hypothetical protein
MTIARVPHGVRHCATSRPERPRTSFEPIGEGTRVTLKIEYEPGGREAALPRRIDAALESFVSFFELARARAAAPA